MDVRATITPEFLTDEMIGSLPGAAVILKHRKLRDFLRRGLKAGKVKSESLISLLDNLNVTEDEETEVYGAIDALGIPVLSRADTDECSPDYDDDDGYNPSSEGPVFTDDSLSIFMQELGAYDIPTKQEVVEMCKRLEAGRMAQATLDAMQAEGREPEEAHSKELQRTIRRAKDAKDRIVNGNLRLVVSIAKKQVMNTSSMELLDLIQEGSIGLMKAAEKFDYRRNFQFSTYATWWIRQAIGRAVAEQDRCIRIPVYMTDVMTKLNTIKREANRELTEEELAIALSGGQDAWESLSKKGQKRYIEKVQKANQLETTSTPLSMDFPKSDGPDADAFGDFIADPSETASPELMAERFFMSGDFDHILSSLPAREARVIRLRFGMVDGKQRKLEEIGREFRLTRERIRQIEASALAKLRTHRLAMPLSAYIEDVFGDWDAGYDEVEDADWENLDS